MLAIIWLLAAAQGAAPAATLPLTKSSWARLSSTPGWAKTAAAVTAFVRGDVTVSALAAKRTPTVARRATATVPAASRTRRGDLDKTDSGGGGENRKGT